MTKANTQNQPSNLPDKPTAHHCENNSVQEEQMFGDTLENSLEFFDFTEPLPEKNTHTLRI